MFMAIVSHGVIPRGGFRIGPGPDPPRALRHSRDEEMIFLRSTGSVIFRKARFRAIPSFEATKDEISWDS